MTVTSLPIRLKLERNLRLGKWLYGLRGTNLFVLGLGEMIGASLHFGGFQLLIISALAMYMQSTIETYTGYFGDRFGRKRSFILGALMAAAAMAGYAFEPSGWVMYAWAVVHGLGFSFMIGADSSLMHDSLKALGREDKTRPFDKKMRSLYARTEGLSAFGLAGLGAASLLLHYTLSDNGILWLQAIVFAVLAMVAGGLLETERKAHTISLAAIKAKCREPQLRYAILLKASVGNLSGVLVWWTPLYFLSYSSLGIGSSSGYAGLVYYCIWGVLLLSVEQFGRFNERIVALPYRGIRHAIAFATACYVAVVCGPLAFGLSGIWGTYAIRANSIPIANKLVDRLVNDEERATVHSYAQGKGWRLCSLTMAFSALVAWATSSPRIGIAFAGVITISIVAFAEWKCRKHGVLTELAPAGF